MTGHDPYRGQTDSLTGQPTSSSPAALTGDGGHTVRVPSGSVADVTSWIDNAKSAAQRHERAAAALEAESSKAKPRKGVLTHAEAALAAA